MTNNPPRVQLTVKRVLCARHGEDFRLYWPQGYKEFAEMAFRAVMKDPDFVKECGGESGEKNIGDRLDKHPLCCRIDKELYTQILYGMGLK